MPTIIIGKSKINRGLDDQRRAVIFDQGVLVNTLDTKRLYVGDGITYGGVSIGSKNRPNTSYHLLSTTRSEIGDLVASNNTIYQLSATDYGNINNWVNLGTKIDSRFFNYGNNNILSLNQSSISAIYLDPYTINTGLIVNSGFLQIDYIPTFFGISSNKLSLNNNSISSAQIHPTTFGNGLSGGSSTAAYVRGNQFFNFDPSSRLSLNLPGFVGNGLKITNITDSLSSINVNYDNDGIVSNLNNQLTLVEYTPTSTMPEWRQVDLDKFGKVSGFGRNMIHGALSCIDGVNTIFNGSPNSMNVGSTVYQTLSSGGITVTLSSAGFITFEDSIVTRNGTSVQRFAIPIFKY